MDHYLIMGPRKHLKRVLEYSPYGTVHRDIINLGYKRRRQLEWIAAAEERERNLKRIKANLDHIKLDKLADSGKLTHVVRRYLSRRDRKREDMRQKESGKMQSHDKYNHGLVRRYNLRKYSNVPNGAYWIRGLRWH